MEEPGRLQSMGRDESDTTERLHFHFSLSCIGEGNGNPFQYSCLENPMDRRVWRIIGVTKNGTGLSIHTRMLRTSALETEKLTFITNIKDCALEMSGFIHVTVCGRFFFLFQTE